MNGAFPLIISNATKRAQFSFRALYLPSTTSHSLCIECGCF